MATDVTSDAAVPVVEATQPPEPKKRRLYFGKFALVYLILAVAFVGTGAGGVIATYGFSVKSSGPWSLWKPSGSPSAQTAAIAQQVGSTYKLPTGHQLLDIYPKRLTVPVATSSGQANIPIAAVAIRAKGQPDKISILSDGDSRIFQFCGSGAACAIGEGKASVARGQLVRREALEVALYTLKYVHGVSHVIAFMPPPPGSQPSTLVYIDKSDVHGLLSKPLSATLAGKPPLPTKITPAEGNAVDQVMMPHLYKFTLQQTQLGQAVLVLAPAA